MKLSPDTENSRKSCIASLDDGDLEVICDNCRFL
jgi:hypothetical protein